MQCEALKVLLAMFLYGPYRSKFIFYGYGGGGPVSLGLKRPRRAADHTPPDSAKVTENWDYISSAQGLFKFTVTSSGAASPTWLQ